MQRMRLHQILFVLLVAVGTLMSSALRADEPRLLSDKAKIYLVTCSPGEALYERYGHTAIMVLDEELGISDIYNYGIFDFNTSHFYWRFVRGETYYQLGKEHAEWFMGAYIHSGRQVYIQELNLSPANKDAIYRALIINHYPENRVYLYNFVFDNCATRPYFLLKQALCDQQSPIDSQLSPFTSTYTGAEGVTYRKFIQHYTPKGSWGDLGINLLFGPKADRPMQGEERLFLPEELMYYISAAHYADGTPLVASEHIRPFGTERIPWYKTWYFGLAMLFVVLALISLHDRWRGQRTRWVDYILYGVYILLLALVTFLTFFSIHPLVGYGSYLLIIPSIHLCARIIYLWR